MMNIVLLILTTIISIPVIVFTLEVFLSFLPLRKIKSPIDAKDPAVVVLVPAHNESGTIENTLVSVNKQLKEGDRILVVADNCVDDTADIARSHGAIVIERVDHEKLGKGYALDYGVRYLENSPPDILIVIDADCHIDSGTLSLLANKAMGENKPVQALNLMSYNSPTTKQRLAEFAWLVKNYVRPIGLHNIGMPCQLMGTGMAFPWPVIASANIATGNIVEDVKMGLDMAAAGYAPIFCPDARVISSFPDTFSAEHGQRKRWEHGHLSTILNEVPEGIVRSIRTINPRLLILILDLSVPPLALLTIILLCMLILSVTHLVLGGAHALVYFNLILLCFFFVSTLLAWYTWGRKVISFLDLLQIPLYIVKKIPLYALFLIKKESSWVRTSRNKKQ